MRYFWRIYVPIALWVFALVPFGGTIQEFIDPIRSEQSITNVVREESPHRLCWDWNSIKNRNVASSDIDVLVDVGHDRYSAGVYEADTHEPWAASRAVSVGRHKQPFCIDLRPGIKPEDSVTVHQTIAYPGWLPWYTVHVTIPDVVD